jgi:uncharacterized protein (DUF111 family)
MQRRKLARETGSVATPFGEVAVKVHYREGEVITLSPEYESCKKASDETGIPIKEVYTAAQSAAEKKFRNLKRP